MSAVHTSETTATAGQPAWSCNRQSTCLSIHNGRPVASGRGVLRRPGATCVSVRLSRSPQPPACQCAGWLLKLCVCVRLSRSPQPPACRCAGCCSSCAWRRFAQRGARAACGAGARPAATSTTPSCCRSPPTTASACCTVRGVWAPFSSQSSSILSPSCFSPAFGAFSSGFPSCPLCLLGYCVVCASAPAWPCPLRSIAVD
jgi:hypothetical protein